MYVTIGASVKTGCVATPEQQLSVILLTVVKRCTNYLTFFFFEIDNFKGNALREHSLWLFTLKLGYIIQAKCRKNSELDAKNDISDWQCIPGFWFLIVMHVSSIGAKTYSQILVKRVNVVNRVIWRCASQTLGFTEFAVETISSI